MKIKKMTKDRIFEKYLPVAIHQAVLYSSRSKQNINILKERAVDALTDLIIHKEFDPEKGTMSNWVIFNIRYSLRRHDYADYNQKYKEVTLDEMAETVPSYTSQLSSLIQCIEEISEEAQEIVFFLFHHPTLFYNQRGNPCIKPKEVKRITQKELKMSKKRRQQRMDGNKRVDKRLRKVMRNKPLPYQTRGVYFALRKGGRVIIADDMGLGKSYQAIGFSAIKKRERPIVVVCPSFMKWKWKREFWKHAGIRAEVIEGNKVHSTRKDVLIINYEILNKGWLEHLKKKNPKIFIIDEAHKIKNRDAKRSKQCKKLSKKIPNILALTGTPFLSRPSPSSFL